MEARDVRTCGSTFVFIYPTSYNYAMVCSDGKEEWDNMINLLKELRMQGKTAAKGHATVSINQWVN